MKVSIIIILSCFGLNSFSQELLKIKIKKPVGTTQKCTATLLGRAGGNITRQELWACNSIQVYGPCSYKVVSFCFSWTHKDVLREVSVQDSLLNAEARKLMIYMEPYDKFYIDKINVKSNVTGQTFTLSPLKFKIVP